MKIHSETCSSSIDYKAQIDRAIIALSRYSNSVRFSSKESLYDELKTLHAGKRRYSFLKKADLDLFVGKRFPSFRSFCNEIPSRTTYQYTLTSGFRTLLRLNSWYRTHMKILKQQDREYKKVNGV